MNVSTKLFSILGLSLALAGTAFAQNNNPTPGGKGATPPKDTAAQPEPKGPKAGDKAPAFALKDLKGTEHKLADYSGKIVVLEWVNPKCPVCQQVHHDGRVGNMLKEINSMKDVVFLGISSNSEITVDQNVAKLKEYGLEYPVLMDADTAVAQLYGARTTPHVFVIDGKGILRYQGALDNDKTAKLTADKKPVTNYVLNSIKQIQANETVSPDYVPSYGCHVNYVKKDSAASGKDKAKDKTKTKG